MQNKLHRNEKDCICFVSPAFCKPSDVVMPFVIRLRSLRRNQPVSNRNSLLNPHRLFIAVTFALAPLVLNAQEIAVGNDDSRPIEERILYSHESTMHITIHTQGLGLGFKSGKVRSIYKTTYWDFEISFLRSLKQIKLINPFSTTSFVYGKLNDALCLRGGYEVSRRIYGKPYWGGVELRWLYEAGLEVALLKPYYYSVVVAEPTSTGEYIQSRKYDTFDHHSEWIEIVGRAPFTYGFKEIKFRPGIFVKGGMEFEIGTTRQRAQSIEVGAVVEYFPIGISLMAENPEIHFLPTFYLSYNWGLRYNKY